MEKHDTVLLACAELTSRRQLWLVLQERYNLLEASNLRQMLLLLEHNLDCIAAIVIGTSTFREDVARIRTQQTDELLSRVPVIIVTEEEKPGDLTRYFRWGALDVIPLRYDAYAMLRRIESITQLHLHRQHLQAVVQEQADRLRRANDDMVDVLTSIIEYRSMESGHHIRRIRNFTRILMEEVMNRCPEYQLTGRQVTIISSASALHDIGKIAIPDAVLTKPGPLTAEQWEIMKTHTTTGCKILNTLGTMADQEYLRYAHNICHYHHERWDGAGYPEGLSGDRIPICAQVVGLADAFEALTSKRVYKDACSFNQAFNMILQGQCGAFSPKLLECFKNAAEAFEALCRAYADGSMPEDGAFDMTLLPPGEEQENSLSRTRAKYYALVHYIGAFLVEVNLDRELFHVVYNPYPELARLEGVTTLHQLIGLMLDRIVVPREREAMARLIDEDIPAFVRNDLRRTTHRFHYQKENGTGEGSFEMTLLRIDSASRRSLAVLCRKLEEGAVEPSDRSQAGGFAENACICCNDQPFTLVRMGMDLERLTGWTLEELQAQTGGSLSGIIYPEDRIMVREAFSRQLCHGTLVHLEHRIVQRNGRVRWVAHEGQRFLGRDGQEYLRCFLVDITRTRQSQEQLQQTHGVYRGILERTQTILFDWDVVRDQFTVSESWKKTFRFGRPEGDIHRWLASNPHIHPDDTPLLLDRIANLQMKSDHETVAVRIANDRGRYTWYRFRLHGGRDREGRLTNIAGVISNVDAEKQMESLLKEQADRDPLTKLLNKAAGRKQVQTYLSYYPQGVSCAMLILDLDNFKQVNDLYGHLFGDAILAKAAQKIREQFRDQDILCRIGGDEFMVLVRGLSDRPLLDRRCRQLVGAIRGLRGQHEKLSLSCSIGIALSPEHGTSYYELFQHADQALYQAKADGKDGFCFYQPREQEFTDQRANVTTISQRIDSDEAPGLARDTFLRHVFDLLYSFADVDVAVKAVVTFLGRQTNVSRVYIFENTPDNRFCNNTFEWCNDGIAPEIGNLQGISYETDIQGYEENFNEEGVFYCPDISVLPKNTYDIVASQGIKSMLQCALRRDGSFRGYIGFDECEKQRLWTKEEIHLLTYVSRILSVFLMQHREKEWMQRQMEQLQARLEQEKCNRG